MLFQGNLTEIESCLACDSNNLELILDLGSQPLANSFKNTKDEVQNKYPLAINLCKNCFHVQLTHAVNPDLLFKDYLYVSGTSITMRDHFKWFADHTLNVFKHFSGRDAEDVLDIGCNDGSQLDQYKLHNLSTFGVDPAENLHQISSKKHYVYKSYFDMEFVKEQEVKYDIIVAQNVFAHNYNPVGFIQAARNIMDDDSLLFVQTSQADMIKNNEFDTIYHEHLSFYCVNSMNELCRRMSMFLVDVIKCPLHGNSFIFVISKNPHRSRPTNIANLISMERLAGLHNVETYRNYAVKCNRIVKDLREAIAPYQSLNVGYWIVGYGAAAKGMTLLNYADIRPDFIVDDNVLKQGKFTPGSSIEIFSADKLKECNDPVLFIPLAWNFFDEIRANIKSKRQNKYDKFCVYFPDVKVIE